MSPTRMLHRPMLRAEHQLLVWMLVCVLAAILALMIANRLGGQSAWAAPSQSEGSAVIVSPREGIFHAGDYPGGPPLVEPGQFVSPETVVGTIESMDKVHTVRANVWGAIVSMMVEDGSYVTPGQPLFTVRHSHSPGPMQ